MKKDTSFVGYVVHDILGRFPSISARAMFGGYGIYREGVMFGIVADSMFYVKAHKEDELFYVNLGSTQFTYEKQGKSQVLGYWSLDESVLENRELLEICVEKSYECALAASVRKRK